MQPPRSTPMAREAVESPAMSQSTTEIRIVPLAPSQDVLTDLLRDRARRLLAQAIEAEVDTWIEAHSHLKDQIGREQSWKELLLDCKARGLEVEPALAIGDGAL